MTGARRLRGSSDDSGAYAVIYAALVVVLIGVSALVVDLSLMRESRATNRSAADAAVTAAASRLNAVDSAAGNPQLACETAWDYLLASIPGLPDEKSSCSSLPVIASDCDPSVASKADASPDGWAVRITWPVPDDSDLLEEPDVFGSNPTQEVNPDIDGTEDADVCARIGVEVYQPTSILLGAVFGFSGTVDTRAASVARNTATGGDSNVIAGLNLLEPDECAALDVSGNGHLRVEGVDNRSGIVAVESSGDGCVAGDYTITTTGGGGILATGAGEDGGGAIQSYALTVGNADRVAPDDGSVDPAPTPLALQSGSRPVLEVFDCAEAPCGDGGGQWVSVLTSALGSGDPPNPYVGAAAPWNFQDFSTLPGSDLPDFTCDATDPLVVPDGNWFIDCPDGLEVSGTLIFERGTIVTSGGVAVTDSGCLAVNVTAPTDDPPDCAAVGPAPVSTGDAILYVRNGSLTKDNDARLLFPQTFVYLADGTYDLEGGDGALYWTHPQAQDCGQEPSGAICRAQRFSPLVVWSESDDLHRLGVDGDDILGGIVFTPGATTELGASTQPAQVEAQFWTRRMTKVGNADMVVRADPAASIPRPAPGVLLIR
jgi:hypothetical protein